MDGKLVTFHRLLYRLAHLLIIPIIDRRLITVDFMRKLTFITVLASACLEEMWA
jgi:hypothetical protein